MSTRFGIALTTLVASVLGLTLGAATASERVAKPRPATSVGELDEAGTSLWSPAGNVIAYQRGYGWFSLETIRPNGSAAQTLAPADLREGRLAFSPDGRRIAHQRGNALLVRRVDGKGPPTWVVGSELVDFAWAPDSRRLAILTGPGEGGVDDHLTGFLITDARGRVLQRLPVEERVDSNSVLRAWFGVTWSADGRFVGVHGGDEDPTIGPWFWRSIVFVHAVGTSLPTKIVRDAYAPRFSPRGSLLAWQEPEDPDEPSARPGVHVGRLEKPRPNTYLGRGGDPVWSPDATRLAFGTDAAGDRGWTSVRVASASGRWAHTIRNAVRPHWSRDGRRLAVTAGSRIRIFDGTGKRQLWSLRGRDPSWGPDGRFVFLRPGCGASSGLHIGDLARRRVTLLVPPKRCRITAAERGGRLQGTPLHDRIDGSNRADTIDGGRGNDEIHGGPGRDVLGGGPGNDLLIGGDATTDASENVTRRDVIRCGPGTDKVYADRIDQVSSDCENVQRYS